MFCLGLAGLALAGPRLDGRRAASGPAPQIGWIDFITDTDTGKRYATVHFDTDPNRTYNVQSAAGFPATNWTTIYTARSLPFANHYVVADEMTNTFRTYRLFAVP